MLSHRWSDWMRNNIKKCIAWHDILRTIYDVLDEIRLKNERSVNSAFHLQQSIDFPLHGCYTATWHLEKQKPFSIFEGLRYERPHGTFSCDEPDYIVILLLFSKMSSGYPGFENWMTVQFDTVSEKQATITQRMCEPPRSWDTAQKTTGPGTWLGRTAKWKNIKLLPSLHFKEKLHGNLLRFRRRFPC